MLSVPWHGIQWRCTCGILFDSIMLKVTLMYFFVLILNQIFRDRNDKQSARMFLFNTESWVEEKLDHQNSSSSPQNISKYIVCVSVAPWHPTSACRISKLSWCHRFQIVSQVFSMYNPWIVKITNNRFMTTWSYFLGLFCILHPLKGVCDAIFEVVTSSMAVWHGSL